MCIRDSTYRTNPIAPAVVGNESLFLQLISDLLTAYMEKDSKKGSITAISMINIIRTLIFFVSFL